MGRNNTRRYPSTFSLPPDELINKVTEAMDPGVPRQIIDVDMKSGQVAVQLARRGHFVTGITENPQRAEAARRLAANTGVMDYCTFVVGDFRTHLPGHYDVAISSRMLHRFNRGTGHSILETIRNHTKQGGLNVISGFLLEPDAPIDHAKLESKLYFLPGELQRLYATAGWLITHSLEESHPPQVETVGRENRIFIRSEAQLVAQRPWTLAIQ